MMAVTATLWWMAALIQCASPSYDKGAVLVGSYYQQDYIFFIFYKKRVKDNFER